MGVQEAITVAPVQDSLKRVEAAELRLGPREMAAYRMWSRGGQPRLSPSLVDQYFQLYLQGKTCDEIVRLNRGLSLAQLVTARVENDWDAVRDEYIRHLCETSRSRYQQASLESVQFMADLLAVANKQFGDAARQYLQTGDEKLLKGFKIDSIQQYKRVVEIMRLLVGADQAVVPPTTHQTVSGDVTHHHVVEQPVVDVRRQMRGEEADAVLREALGE